MTIVVNFLAGSGTGKTTVASDVFSRLKKAGIESELASEFAKDLVWERSFDLLKNQIFIFGNQFLRIDRLINKVDVVITDSPLLLSIMFKQPWLSNTFNDLVLEVHNQYNNLNYFIERTIPYNPIGRVEKTINEAINKDNEIRQILVNNEIPYKSIINNEEDIQNVVNDIVNKLESK